MQTPTLKLQTSDLDLAGHFVAFIKIERASNYVHFWGRLLEALTIG